MSNATLTRAELDALNHAATQSMTQLGSLKSQVKATQGGFGGLKKAVNNLSMNGMDALSGTLSGVQGLFQSLGVELGSTSQRVLNVATATTKLAGSFIKLGKVERVSKAMGSLNDAWGVGIKNAGGLKKINSLGITKLNLKAITAGLKTVAFNAATIASKALGLALKAIPFVAAAAAIGALVAAGAKLISWLFGAGKAARDHERAIEGLSAQYGVSTEEIEADMERMSITCTDTWERVNNAAQDAANTFGGCANEIRGEIAELVYHYGDYEIAIESWRVSQMIALEDVATRWGTCAYRIKESLGEMTLDEWVAKQEANLNDLSEAWNVCTSTIQRELQEQGITMNEWESQQRTMLQGVADEWGTNIHLIRAQMAEQGISADEWTARMGEAWDRFNADVDRNVDSIINGFRRIPEAYEKDSQTLLAIMEDNITRTESWRENMVKISEEVGPEMLAWLESKGPEFNSVIDEMLECGDELKAWVDAFDRTTALATEKALDNIDDPIIQETIERRLNKTGEAISDHQAVAIGFETMMDDANDRGVAIAELAGQDVGDAFLKKAKSIDYASVPKYIGQELEAGQPNIVEPIHNATTTMIDRFQKGMEILNSTAASGYADLGATTESGIKPVPTTFDTGMNSMNSTTTKGFAKLNQTTSDGMSNISTTTQSGFKPVPTTFKTGMNSMNSSTAKGFAKLNQTTTSSMSNISTTIQSGFKPVPTTFETGMTSLNSTVTSGFSNLRKTTSESMSNIASTTKSGFRPVPTTFETGMNHVSTTVGTNLSNIVRLFGQLPSNLQPPGRQAITTLNGISTNMVSTMNPIERSFGTIGRNIMGGLLQGILDRKGAVIAAANRVADAITRTIQRAQKMNSPSRVMRDQVGRFIPEGIAAGIDKYADAALDSVHKLSNDLINLNLPSIESMIGLEPNLRLAGMTTTTNVMNDNYSVSNQGLFDGATIHWHGEEDIRHTMEKIAWVTEREKARMW